MAQPTALLVEDTLEYVMLATRLLEAEGYVVHHTPDGVEAVELARRHRPELILLDLTLANLDGIEVCRQLRQFTDSYIIMLTARDHEIDRVLGLTVGADDYVIKPFSPREVSARIRAMRRRPRPDVDAQVRQFGHLTVDPVAREVTRHGEPVELTKIEFDLLAMLTVEPRRTVARDVLLNAIWGQNWFGDDHVIDVHLGNLRRKLGENGTSPRHLKTVRGVGYRFDP
jgi:DNA-binding response OmpR family regulator